MFTHASFLARLEALIHAHIADPSLDVSTISSALHLSRTPIHNKIKALTGMSTTEYVRFIRLSKAQELLQDTNLNVSEVAHAVGFQHHAYFSRKFKELTGMRPKEWREKSRCA